MGQSAEALWASFLQRAIANRQADELEWAEKWYRLAVTAAEQLGEGRQLAETLSGLAETLQASGRFAEGRPYLERALAIDERLLGVGDLRVLRDRVQLAYLQICSEDWAAAEATLVQLLKEAPRAELGHDLLAWAKLQLLLIRDQLGDHREADSLSAEALSEAERAFGKNDPRLVPCLEARAVVLARTGREIDAAGLEARAEVLRGKVAARGTDEGDDDETDSTSAGLAFGVLAGWMVLSGWRLVQATIRNLPLLPDPYLEYRAGVPEDAFVWLVSAVGGLVRGVAGAGLIVRKPWGWWAALLYLTYSLLGNILSRFLATRVYLVEWTSLALLVLPVLLFYSRAEKVCRFYRLPERPGRLTLLKVGATALALLAAAYAVHLVFQVR